MIRRVARRLSRTRRHHGLRGVLSLATDSLLATVTGLRIVHLLDLDTHRIPGEPTNVSRLMYGFLGPEEVRRLSRDASNHLSGAFVERARSGLDLCFAAMDGNRLANYAWYAIGSVEAEHASGTPLGLPVNVVYMYKAFTHPAFRGRRINGACMGAAATELAARGVDHVVAMVRWSNSASLRSCARLGFRRLGVAVLGSHGPLRVPSAARRLGISFGRIAAGQVEARRR